MKEDCFGAPYYPFKLSHILLRKCYVSDLMKTILLLNMFTHSEVIRVWGTLYVLLLWCTQNDILSYAPFPY